MKYNQLMMNEEAINKLLDIPLGVNKVIELIVIKDQLGEKLPYSARMNGMVSLELTDVSYLKAYVGDKENTLLIQYCDDGMLVRELGDMKEDEYYNELVDLIDELGVVIPIYDLNDELVISELRDRDVEALDKVMLRFNAFNFKQD